MSLVQSRVAHYKQLLHFAKHRFEPGEYARMRRYFADLLVRDLREDAGYTVNAKTVLEVGGDSGEFSAFLQSQGASCVNLEYRSDVATRGCFQGTVIGDGTSMPFEDRAFDFVLCRGVIEHIPPDLQEGLVRECFRVTKEGGLCLLNTSPWYSPFAGHALRPFHLLPFPVAKRLKRLLGAKDLSDVSSFEELCLYPVTMRRLEAFIRRTGFATLATKDYHVRVHWFTKIPLAREALTQSVTYLLRKDASSPSNFADQGPSTDGAPLERQRAR